MDEIKLILTFLTSYGLLGVLVIILILIVHDPDRAIKLKALLIRPFFVLAKWGSKQYIASEVGFQATEFLKRFVTGVLAEASPVRVKVRWVTSAQDPILSSNGTLILRLREERDQTLNILTATKAAIPQVVCPLVRPCLEKYARAAIDLTLLQKLASKLGKHARLVFQNHFLHPETEGDQRVAELFARLVELDQGGLFVSIFLEELEYLGEGLYSSGDTLNRTDEILALLAFLQNIVRREIGENIELTHHSRDFHVGVILVAKSAKAESQGVSPYLWRLNKDLSEGCENIYLFAYSHASDFFRRVMDTIEEELKVIVKKEIGVVIDDSTRLGGNDRAKIALVRKNAVFANSAFEEQLKLAGIQLGDLVEGVVTDVAAHHALVTTKGLKGHIHRLDCSWQTIDNCNEILLIGQKLTFVVIRVDKNTGILELSLRLPASDPWVKGYPPKVGDLVQCEVVTSRGDNYVCHLESGMEALLPLWEISWFDIGKDKADKKVIGTKQDVLVYDVRPSERLILCSLRQKEVDPWPQIHKSYPKGTRLEGKVIERRQENVKVQLPNGLIGYVPKESFKKAGYEYSNFEINLLDGQILDVVITKVFLGRQRIRLDLTRNLKK